MGVNKKNILIVSLLVLISLIFNIVVYFRSSLKYPLFYYHYFATDGNSFQIQYIRDINNTDRVFKLTLPEYNDMPLLIDERYNGMNFLNSTLYPNEVTINSHYVLQNLTCSLPFEDSTFKDIFEEYKDKDMKINKIRYHTSTGKTAILDIGKIVVSKVPQLNLDDEIEFKFSPYLNNGENNKISSKEIKELRRLREEE